MIVDDRWQKKEVTASNGKYVVYASKVLKPVAVVETNVDNLVGDVMAMFADKVGGSFKVSNGNNEMQVIRFKKDVVVFE